VYVCNFITGKVRETKADMIREPRSLCVGQQDTVFVCSENTGCTCRVQ